MPRRWIWIVVVLTLIAAISTGLPVRAQGARKVVHISLVSFQFIPSLFTVNRGDTVVLQLSNDDPDKRNHSFAARWLVGKEVVVRGTVAQEGIDDERRFFAMAPGQQAEIEFVASEAGSFPFVCGIFNHGARGQTGAMNVVATH